LDQKLRESFAGSFRLFAILKAFCFAQMNREQRLGNGPELLSFFASNTQSCETKSGRDITTNKRRMAEQS